MTGSIITPQLNAGKPCEPLTKTQKCIPGVCLPNSKKFMGKFRLALRDSNRIWDDMIVNTYKKGYFFIGNPNNWSNITGNNETWAELNLNTIDINGNNIITSSGIFSDVDAVGGIPVYPGVGYNGYSMCYTLTNDDGSSMISFQKVGRPSHLYGRALVLANALRLIGQSAGNNQDQTQVVNIVASTVGTPQMDQVYSLYYGIWTPNNFSGPPCPGAYPTGAAPNTPYYPQCSPRFSSLNYFNNEG
jgi:hypothetical protein